MNSTQTVKMSPLVKKMRWLALVSHIALIVWMAVWYFGLSNVHNYSNTFIVLVYIVPLLLPLKGIVQGKPYTHAWTSFIVLLYFLHAITVIYAEPTQILYASIELLLAIGLFTGCAVYARLRGQELGIGLRKLSEVMAEEKKRFEG
jgi:uncharacterized membrane protein